MFGVSFWSPWLKEGNISHVSLSLRPQAILTSFVITGPVVRQNMMEHGGTELCTARWPRSRELSPVPVCSVQTTCPWKVPPTLRICLRPLVISLVAPQYLRIQARWQGQWTLTFISCNVDKGAVPIQWTWQWNGIVINVLSQMALGLGLNERTHSPFTSTKLESPSRQKVQPLSPVSEGENGSDCFCVSSSKK